MALLEDGVESGHADPATTTGPAQELVAERWRGGVHCQDR